MKNRNFLHRLRFAINGLYVAYKEETSFRTQFYMACMLCILLILTEANSYWWIIFIFNIFLVLSFELINTALERMMDFTQPNRHPLVKIAKDCAAAAVLLQCFVSIVLFILYSVDFFNKNRGH